VANVVNDFITRYELCRPALKAACSDN